MTITYTPQYPVSSETVSLAMTGAVGTAFAFELTAVPSESSLGLGLLLDDQVPGAIVPTSPLIAANSDLVKSDFIPDVAGEYSFIGYDMRQVVGVPSFQNDPSAVPRYELLGKQTGTVSVGTLMELPVVTTESHGGDLQLRVVNNYIRAAAIVNPRSDIGRIAALQGEVLTALSSVVNQHIDSASTNFLEALRDLRLQYSGEPAALPVPILGHRNYFLGDVHKEADSVNALDGGIPFSLKYAVKLVNEVRTKLIGHFEDSIKYAVEIAAGPPPEYDRFWHYTSANTSTTFADYGSNPGVDSTCTPVIGAADDLPSAVVLLCDLRLRSYSRHLLLGHAVVASHKWLSRDNMSLPHGRKLDTEHSLTVPPSMIDDIIVSYLDSIIRMDSGFSPPVAEGAGIADMAHKYGFKVTS